MSGPTVEGSRPARRLPSQGSGFPAMSPRDQAWEQLRLRYGPQVAEEIWAFVEACPARVPLRQAVAWAERKREKRETARLAATGWDPDEEYRRIPGGSAYQEEES